MGTRRLFSFLDVETCTLIFGFLHTNGVLRAKANHLKTIPGNQKATSEDSNSEETADQT